MRRGVLISLLVAAIVATALGVHHYRNRIDLSDSRWIFAKVRRELRLPEMEVPISAGYRTLPDEARYEIVYACGQDVEEARAFYSPQLRNVRDDGGAVSLKLEGEKNGRAATVRNYFSEVANVYCVTLELTPDEIAAVDRAVRELPAARILETSDALADLRALEPYGGFVFYNLEPLDLRMPYDRPVFSRAFRADAADGTERRGEAVADAVDGFDIKVAGMRTDAGIRLMTVRIQEKGELPNR